jgi:cytochrome c-type biogenesis protein CcmE
VKAKNQRLTLIGIAAVAMVGAVLLAMSALKDEAAYFYSPADLATARPTPDQALRLGGMVADKSIKRDTDGVTIHFVVTDGKAQTPVSFTGIAPDLFKEKSGVVAEGKLRADGVFVADNILAKHDERYMPPQMEGKMHKTGTLKS